MFCFSSWRKSSHCTSEAYSQSQGWSTWLQSWHQVQQYSTGNGKDMVQQYRTDSSNCLQVQYTGILPVKPLAVPIDVDFLFPCRFHRRSQIRVRPKFICVIREYCLRNTNILFSWQKKFPIIKNISYLRKLYQGPAEICKCNFRTKENSGTLCISLNWNFDSFDFIATIPCVGNTTYEKDEMIGSYNMMHKTSPHWWQQ